MAVATSIEIRQVALAKESVRGTAAAAPSKFFSLVRDSNLDFTTKLLPDPALRGYNAPFPSFAGAQEAKGPWKTPLRASSICELMAMLLGPVASSTEQASLTVVTGSNDTIDWSTFSATVAAGTYTAGQTHLDTGSLCALLYTAMKTADATVSEISYSRSAQTFTIAFTSGTPTIKWNTGTNKAKSIGPLIGFPTTADSTGANTYTGAVVVVPFKHSWAQGSSIQPQSYTFFINRGMADLSGNKTKVYNLGALSKLKFSSKDDSPVEIEASLMAQQEATYAGAWSPAYNESPVLMFNHVTVKIAGSAPSVPNVAEWSVEFDPGLKPYRPLSTYQYPLDFLAVGPFRAAGDMIVYFMDETERAKFIADTLTSLEFLIVGSVVGGTVKHTVDLLLPYVEYEAFPFGDEGGFLGAKVRWKAPGNFVSGAFVPVVSPYVINAVVPGF